MTAFAIRFNVRTSRASERRAELAPAMPNAAENGQSQCFCFIFDEESGWTSGGKPGVLFLAVAQSDENDYLCV